MIENLRKYTGVIVVSIVLVLIGFLFMDTGSMRGSQGGSPFLKIAGRNYTDKDFQHLGASPYQLIQSLAQSGDFNLYTFLFTLAGDAQSQDQAVINFFTNRILLRTAKAEFGIFPGDPEIDSFIRKLRAFASPEGDFSQEKYRDFIEKSIGRLGLTEGDLRELASDILTQQKLVEILGSGLAPDRQAIAKKIAIENQQIRVNLARIDIDPIEEKIKPSDEEIKLHWETIQDAFKTEEKRKFTYFIAAPTFEPEPAEIPALAAEATAEAKAEFEKQKADRSAKLADARRKAQLITDEKIDDFLYQLESQKSLSFEDLAKKGGWELVTTEAFPLSAPPEALKVSLRSSSTEGNAASELFRMQATADPFSKISPAIAVGENQWLIARLDETEKSRDQTFAEARAEARAQLIAEKASAALKTEAEAATEKIKAAIAAGKPFAEAAKAAGITTEVTAIPAVNTAYKADPATAPSALFAAVKFTDPGTLADPIIESDRAFIVHVEAREVVKQEDANTAIEAQVKQATDSNKITAFTSWLTAENEAADVKTLYKQP
ncbi:MAG: SurA N-terminal domain-containing protein [Armatimonadetes bacterium]|nr:SurA N-terminal domain-containing protein [Akkermansiaceae bacterium]